MPTRPWLSYMSPFTVKISNQNKDPWPLCVLVCVPPYRRFRDVHSPVASVADRQLLMSCAVSRFTLQQPRLHAV